MEFIFNDILKYFRFRFYSSLILFGDHIFNIFSLLINGLHFFYQLLFYNFFFPKPFLFSLPSHLFLFLPFYFLLYSPSPICFFPLLPLFFFLTPPQTWPTPFLMASLDLLGKSNDVDPFKRLILKLFQLLFIFSCCFFGFGGIMASLTFFIPFFIQYDFLSFSL